MLGRWVKKREKEKHREKKEKNKARQCSNGVWHPEIILGMHKHAICAPARLLLFLHFSRSTLSAGKIGALVKIGDF